jgi:outer membrane receptor protein involved in Fe transport
MSMTNLEQTDVVNPRNAITIAVGVALAGGQTAAQAQGTPGGGRELEEIVVTAQKRTENLQDLSISIQAFSQDDMREQGLFKFEDYARFIPSLSFVSTASGSTDIVFRGVSAGGGSVTDASAALYLDEQPLTQFNVQVDPRLIDIERIEALAGPQGTLYGDSSQSGTLRIITNKPDPNHFSAFADATIKAGSDSEESYDIAGMVNLPLVEDKFAIRLVGFSAHDGGYIDNVLGTSPMFANEIPGQRTNSNRVGDDINGVDFTGGRVAARWTPDDTWAVTAAFIQQTTKVDGNNDYDPTVGDLKTVKFFEETRDDEWWQGALTIEKSFGNGFKFLSATSYFDRKISYLVDRTEYAAYFNFGFCSYYATYCWSGRSNGSVTLVPGSGIDYINPTPNDQDTVAFNTLDQKNERFTQEFRISQETSRYRWVAGLFYEEKTQEWFYRAYTPEFLSTLSYYYWTNSAFSAYYGLVANPSGEPAWWFSHDDVEWKQWAVFGDFTLDLSDKWSVSVGGRWFDQESERVYEVDKRFIDGPPEFFYPDVTPRRKGSDSDFLGKASVTYRIDDEKLVYGLFSQGFRSGGVNRNRGDTSRLVFPEAYEPDYLDNFELGAKTRWLDGKLQVNVTAYYMQWKDFQIEVIDPSYRPGEDRCTPDTPPDELCNNGFQIIVGNVGDAESTGAELSVRAVIGEGLDLGFDASYIDAQIAEEVIVSQTDDDGNPIPVPDGARLPISPEWKLSTYAQYNWPVSFVANGSMYARLQYSWVDESLNQLETYPENPPLTYPNTPQETQDAYGIADFSIALQAVNWEVQAFVNNLSDERGELYWSTFNHHTFFGREQLFTNRPREYGMRFIYRWGE